MKIKELMERLSKYNPDAEVTTCVDNLYYKDIFISYVSKYAIATNYSEYREEDKLITPHIVLYSSGLIDKLKHNRETGTVGEVVSL